MPPDKTLGLSFVAPVTLSSSCSRGMNAGSGKIGRIWSVSTFSLSFSTGCLLLQSVGGVAQRTCRGLRRLCAAVMEDSAILDDHAVDQSGLDCYDCRLFIVLDEEDFTHLALILGYDILSTVVLSVPSRVSSIRMPLQAWLMITL